MSQLFDNQSKILVIQTAYIGDVILATPMAIAIQKKFPSCTIDYLVKKGNEGLLANHPNIRNVISFDKKHKRKSIKQVVSEIRKEKYDVVINLHRFLSSGIITAMSGAKCKIGFKKNPLSWNYHFAFPHHIGYGIHEVDRNLSLLTHFDIHEKANPLVVPTPEDFKALALVLMVVISSLKVKPTTPEDATTSGVALSVKPTKPTPTGPKRLT
jgi:heptosyltransferase-2